MRTTGGVLRRAKETGALVGMLVDYWITVFPAARREVGRWIARAGQIPDRRVRELALRTLEQEGGLAEGAAIMATLVPRRHRAGLVPLLVAWQIAYDYLDTVGEQLDERAPEAAASLYRSLLVALDPSLAHDVYRADGGYLDALIDACRAQVVRLSSHAVVRPQILQAVERCAQGQVHTHNVAACGNEALKRWALERPGSEAYRWWEVAAGAISSLAVHAILATAALPAATTDDALLVDAAYFPSICALSTLLDSTIDQADDAGTANHRSTAYYADSAEAVARLEAITRMAAAAARALPGGRGHAVILAGMTAFYAASGGREHERVHAHVAAALGLETAPILLTLRLRERVRR